MNLKRLCCMFILSITSMNFAMNPKKQKKNDILAIDTATLPKLHNSSDEIGKKQEELKFEYDLDKELQYPDSKYAKIRPFYGKTFNLYRNLISITDPHICKAVSSLSYEVVETTEQTAAEKTLRTEMKIDIGDLTNAILKTYGPDLKSTHFQEYEKIKLSWYQKYIKLTVLGSMCIGIMCKIGFDKLMYQWMPKATDRLVELLTKNKK